MVRIGNLVEESISKGIYELGAEAPILAGTPEEKVWYQVPVPEGKCGDGSEYHIYVRKGTSNKLCVFFSGGGIAINEYMAARPVNGGSVAAWLPNYYWNNLRLFTQVMNINVGITKNGADNPFDDWNFLVITYASFPWLQELHGFHAHRQKTVPRSGKASDRGGERRRFRSTCSCGAGSRRVLSRLPGRDTVLGQRPASL